MIFTKPVLTGISLAVQEGEFVSIVGPSGCGKTTLLRIIAGLLKPTEGSVLINGLGSREACRQHLLGYASQSPALLPFRTTRGNVRLTLEITGQNHTNYQPEDLLVQFGLEKAMELYPHQLSGGMRQRNAIAAAMIHKPPVILMDEPFGALDAILRNMLGDWLANILSTTGQTVVFVTHSISEAVFLSDRVVFMTPDGRLGTSFEVNLPRPRRRELRNDIHFANLVTRANQALDKITQGQDWRSQ